MTVRRLHGCLALMAILLAAGCDSGSDDNGGGQVEDLYGRLEAARQLPDPKEKADELIAVGNAYAARADTEWARNALRDATDAADEIKAKSKPTDRANVHLKLANAWHAVRDTGRCEDAYEEAEDLLDSIDDPVDKTNILIELGRVKIKVKEKNKAVKDLKAAEELSGKIDDVRERLPLLAWVAYGYVEMEDTGEATRVMQVAHDIAEAQEKPSDKSRLLAIVGQEQINSLKDLAAGEATLTEAIELARSIPDNPNLQANVLVDIAQSYAAVGNTDKARELLSEAKDLVFNLSEGKPVLNRIEQLRGEL